MPYAEEREGVLYVAGTRVTMDSVIHAFLEGDSPETIQQQFETLDLVQVYGAITYYLENRAQLARYLADHERAMVQNRRSAAPLPKELAGRIRAARSLHAEP